MKKLRFHNKSIAWLLAILLILGVAAGGTVAFIVTSTQQEVNTFTPGKVTITVDEDVTPTEKSSVKITNTGNIDAYIRVAVVANTLDADGNINGTFDPSAYLCGDGWIPGADGYYYYTSAVAPNGQTSELLTQTIPLTDRSVTIMAEAIQAASDAAIESWGYDPVPND